MTYTHKYKQQLWWADLKGNKDSGSPNKGHTNVEGNIAHSVAHHKELLTLTAFSSCIRELELVTQQWEEDIDSNLAKFLSMIEG